MYYILVDGECHATEDLWEEALITAAQLEFEHNSPEVNNGEIGSHQIEIKDHK